MLRHFRKDRVGVAIGVMLLAIGLLMLAGCGDNGPTTPPAPVTISVSPDVQSMWVNGAQQFTAAVTGTTDTAVTWMADGGTIDASGLYTAPATAGNYHVKATSQADSTKSAVAAIVVTVPRPTFTSTPETAAAQDTPYTYTVAATDPAGTAVTFELVTAPDGATLSGNTISWTPSFQQARQQNAFAVTATTAAGGTDTQAWSVAPTGTVQGSIRISHWSNDGTVEMESNSVEPPAWTFGALIPQQDGSLTYLPGMGYADSTFQVPEVPAGHYWLQFQPGSAIWTDASFMDYGSDAMGRKQRTPLVWVYWTCNLTGLDPWEMGLHTIDFYSINAQAFAARLDQPWYGIPMYGDTTCNQLVNDRVVIPLSQVPGDVTTAVQFEQKPGALGLFSGSVIGPAMNLPFTLDVASMGQQVLVSGELTRQSVKTHDFDIAFSAWKDAFDKGGPSPSVPVGMKISVESRERADALDRTNPMLYGFYPVLANAIADESSAWPKDDQGNNVWPDDGSFGTLEYNDPFEEWDTTVYNTFVNARYQIPFPNSDASVYATVNWQVQSPTWESPLVPALEPIGNPQIDGASLLVPGTVSTVSPTLTWTAPATEGSLIYTITIIDCDPVAAECHYVYDFSHYPKTTFTVPAGILEAGHTYIYLIEATSRTGYDPLHPNRYSLPEAISYLVSAAIAVDGGAEPAVVHGDRSLMFAKPGSIQSPGMRPSFEFTPKKVVLQPDHYNSNPSWVTSQPQEQQQPASTWPQTKSK